MEILNKKYFFLLNYNIIISGDVLSFLMTI